MSDEMVTPYPENEKLAAFTDERNTVIEFLEWLHRRNMWICDAPGEYSNKYYPISITEDRLVMQFLEIDEVKLEQERREMIQAFVTRNL